VTKVSPTFVLGSHFSFIEKTFTKSWMEETGPQPIPLSEEGEDPSRRNHPRMDDRPSDWESSQTTRRDGETERDKDGQRFGWCGWWLRTSFDHPQTHKKTSKESNPWRFSVVTDLRNELGVETQGIHSEGVTFVRDGHPFQLVPIPQELSHRWVIKKKTTDESISFVVTLEWVGLSIPVGHGNKVFVHIHGPVGEVGHKTLVVIPTDEGFHTTTRLSGEEGPIQS